MDIFGEAVRNCFVWCTKEEYGYVMAMYVVLSCQVLIALSYIGTWTFLCIVPMTWDVITNLVWIQSIAVVLLGRATYVVYSRLVL
jgi:hypothetical protein